MNACSVEGCTQVYRCSGYCRVHYERFRKHGDPQAHIPIKIRIRGAACDVDGCSENVRCAGLCSVHYDRMRRRGTTDLPERVRRTCQIETCDLWVYSNGYCRPHDQRIRLTGDPRPHEPFRVVPRKNERDDIEQRILKRSEWSPTGCLEWQGSVDVGGYGGISWRGKGIPTHRAMWIAKRGPLPADDWTLDHLCYNRKCCNVDHLEPVSRAENVMRAMLRKYAGTDNLPDPVLEFLRAASQGLLEGKNFFEPWIKSA